jgi:hypothetical protein
VLTAGTFAYLACLPVGWRAYRAYERRDAEAAEAAAPAAYAPMSSPEGDRPARLN